jgi:hypothetical protein
MYRFYTKQSKQVIVKVEGRGITFLYYAVNARLADPFQVGQSWSGLHALLAKLRNQQTYSANEDSFSAWKQNDELSIRFQALDMPLEETLTFSKEMTVKLLSALETLPNLN